MPARIPETEAELKAGADRLRGWLFDHALPIWLSEGYDPRSGRFFEALDIESGKAAPAPTRARVPPRQVYSFIAGGKLGWQGNWREPALAGFDRYLADFSNPSGLMIRLCGVYGEALDESIDLYDQAFALFALAAVADAFPERRRDCLDRAGAMVDRLRRDLAHPLGGFEEDNPRILPLRSNPHMHLLEAMLALEAIDNKGIWARLADEIATLALTYFIDPARGCLREFFDGDFAPMPGDQGLIVEPGHQFEWAWLLTRWGIARSNDRALKAARRLFDIGANHGVDPLRGVAVMTLSAKFEVWDATARLWPQTEWLKASLIMAGKSEGAERGYFLKSAVDAIAALERFLDVPTRGLWRDKQAGDGSFVEEPAPASSFYHIVCSILELCNYCDKSNGGD